LALDGQMSYPQRRLSLDRRSEPRIAVRQPARIAYGPKLALWADCVIRDRSKSGAKIDLGAIFVLPSRVVLTDLQAGLAFDGVVKWRRGDMAGLYFEQEHDLRGSVEPRLIAVRDTWLALRPGV